MEFILPENVEYILKRYDEAGYEAHCVGGCVRDLLMGNQPQDYDIATNAPCDVTTELFDRVIPTGIQHGTVTVVLGGEPYEITRYRIDGEYQDHRRPESVEFTDDFKLDLSRRDFTVNAIGYNPKLGLCDPYDGKSDIENGIIRTVGEPDRRFSEDALRILRGIRFSSRLGFKIEQNTMDSIIKNAYTLESVSAERIAIELIKTLAGQTPSLISVVINAGGLKNFGMANCEDISILDKLPTSPLLRLAALVFLCKAKVKKVCDSLKLSNLQKREILAYYDLLKSQLPNIVLVKQKIAALGFENCKTAIVGYGLFHGCDTVALQQELEDAKLNSHPYTLDMLAIKGGDIMALGFKGEEISKMQNLLLREVLHRPELNHPKDLIEILKKFQS